MTGNISNEFLMDAKERQQDIVSNAVDGVCRYCIKEDCNGCFVQELKDEAVKDEPVTNPWETFGNVDFLSHGGCFVRRYFAKEPEIHKNVFDVFYLSPKFGEKNENSFAALCCIDLTASWLPWGKMLKYCGFDEDINLSIDELVKKHDPMFLAKKMVTYVGIASFSPSVFKNGAYNMHPRNVEDFMVSNEDVVKWLCILGAENIIDELEKTENTAAGKSCCENMTQTEAKEIITEYVFSNYKLESLYPIVDKKIPDADERNRRLYAETFLTDALQKAVIALGLNEELSKDCGSQCKSN